MGFKTELLKQDNLLFTKGKEVEVLGLQQRKRQILGGGYGAGETAQ